MTLVHLAPAIANVHTHVRIMSIQASVAAQRASVTQPRAVTTRRHSINGIHRMFAVLNVTTQMYDIALRVKLEKGYVVQCDMSIGRNGTHGVLVFAGLQLRLVPCGWS